MREKIFIPFVSLVLIIMTTLGLQKSHCMELEKKDDKVSKTATYGTALETTTLDTYCMLTSLAERVYDDAKSNYAENVTSGFCSEEINNTSWEKHIFPKVKDAAPWGTVYLQPKTNNLVVALHGSFWWYDWLKDFTCLQRPACELSPGLPGNVHRGFSDIVKDFYPVMEEKIKEAWYNHKIGINYIDEIHEIYFTGHSLGAALAILAGTKFFHKNPDLPLNKVKIITFSTPMGVVGDLDFVRFAHAKISKNNIVNIITKGDMVPYIPQNFIYLTQMILFPVTLPLYVPIGTNIEIGPYEKVRSYYTKPWVWQIDRIYDHPAFDLGKIVIQTCSGALIPVISSIIGTVGIKEIGTHAFKTFHSTPSLEELETAVEFTQDNLLDDCNENPGEFSCFCSSERNFVCKYFKTLFRWS